MIIGDCPYPDCGGDHWIPIADPAGQFERCTCEHCGRQYWLYHSRLIPEAFTLDEFEIEEGKKINPVSDEAKKFVKLIEELNTAYQKAEPPAESEIKEMLRMIIESLGSPLVMPKGLFEEEDAG